MHLKENMERLRTKNPSLAEGLQRCSVNSNYKALTSRTGHPTLKVDNYLIHSLYDPVKEAREWVKGQLDKIRGKECLCVFGFGLGYHIEALLEETDSDIIVFEPDMSLMKSAFTLRGLRGIIDRVRIVSTNTVPFLQGRFSVLRHNPSVKLNHRYYELVGERLRLMRLFQKGLRISVVGPIYGGSVPVAEYTVRALKNLGHHVQYVDNTPLHECFRFIDRIAVENDVRAGLGSQFVRFASSSVLARLESFRPDLVIALAQAPLNPEHLQRLREAGLRTAFWFVENYRHLTYWKEFFQYYDYIFVIQKGDFLRGIRETYNKPAHYLPLAALPEFHQPLDLTEEEMSEYGSDLSFVGAGYKNRRHFFTGLIDYDLKIWGDEWDLNSPLGNFIQRGGERISPEEMVKIFNASKININLHSSAVHTGVDPFGDFINPRTFEITATDSFQLVDMRDPLREFFEIGREIETFSSLKELRKKIDYYLSHPDERRDVARAGYEKILRAHTYELRMKEMLEFIFEHDFDLPTWAKEELFIDELTDSLRDAPELIEYLRQFEDKKRIGFDDILERIQSGKGELKEVEKIFLFMREVKEQYSKA